MSAAMMQAFFASQRKLRSQKATDVPDKKETFMLQLDGGSTITFSNKNGWKYEQIRDKINMLSKDAGHQSLPDLAQKVKHWMENGNGGSRQQDDESGSSEVGRSTRQGQSTPLVQVTKKRKVLGSGSGGASASSSRVQPNLGPMGSQLVLRSQFQKMMTAFRNEQEELINRSVMASRTSVLSEAVQSLVRKPTGEIVDEAVEFLTAFPSQAIEKEAVEETVKKLTQEPTEEIEKRVVDHLVAHPTRFMVDAAVDLLIHVPTKEIKDRVLEYFQKNRPGWVPNDEHDEDDEDDEDDDTESSDPSAEL